MMNLERSRVIRRSNSMSSNLAQSKKDDFVFFVLRNKASTFENGNTYEDIFCVVHDSYADSTNSDITTLATTQAKTKPSSITRITMAERRIYRENSISMGKRINTLNRCNVAWKSPCLLKTSKQTEENNHDSDIKTVFNLKLFRDYLTMFEVHPCSSISYMDIKHNVCSVQTETEFLELWKFAKLCAKSNTGVLLLVDFNNEDENMINSNVKIPTVNDQTNPNILNVNPPGNFQLKEDTIEVNNTNGKSSDKQFDEHNDYDTFTPNSNITTSSSRFLREDYSDKKIDSAVRSNRNSQDFLNKTPPIWFVQYMKQFKQDIIKEVSHQVMSNIKAVSFKNQNQNLPPVLTKSPGLKRLEEAIQSENKIYNHRSKSNRDIKSFFIDQKKQYNSIVKTRKKRERKLEGKLDYNSEEDNSKEKGNDYDNIYSISKLMDSMNSIYVSSNIAAENGAVNNRDSITPDFLESQQSSKENLYEPNISNAKEGSEFRMNCSITEHQMLDKTNFTSKTCCCGSDTENISLNSDISTAEDVSTEYNFEMLQKPSTEEVKCFFTKNKDENNKDLSGFCFVPELPSSRSPLICLDEDHFTANSNNIPSSSESSNLNIPSFCEFIDKKCSICNDINTTTRSAVPFNISNKCENSVTSELAQYICKELMENSSHQVHQKTDTESECSNVINSKADINDSHTSYMTTKPINTVYSDSLVTQRSQPQTDSNDLTQSFHSHTTSIADNGVYSIREANTTTSHDYSKHSLSNSNKPTNSNENRTCKQIKNDTSNKNPDKKISKEKSNAKNGKNVNEDTAANSMPGTAEPVHILPETLVTGALHFASFAYGTAREAIVKMRSNTKDDLSTRRRMARF